MIRIRGWSSTCDTVPSSAASPRFEATSTGLCPQNGPQFKIEQGLVDEGAYQTREADAEKGNARMTSHERDAIASAGRHQQDKPWNKKRCDQEPKANQRSDLLTLPHPM